MVRGVYRCLVRLHPSAFRLRFQDEMLWIFEEGGNTFGRASLIRDAVASLFRQWLRNPNVWKWIAASAGGILLLAIAFGSFLPWDRPLGQ